MSRGAHIIALAARTPVGLHAAATAAAIRAGISRVAEHPFLVSVDGERVICGQVPGLEPRLTVAPRIVQLSRWVVAEMMASLGDPRLSGVTIPLLLSLPEPRPGFSEGDVKEVLAELGRDAPTARGPRFGIRGVGRGHAGVLQALAHATDAIARGSEELIAVGGADSYLHGATIDWLEANRRLARDGARGGFPPGEGAAMVLLASDAVRKHLQLPSLGVVRAVACVEERSIGPDDEPLGVALTEAFTRVLSHVRAPEERVDNIYVDINDERARTTDYAFATLRTGAALRDGSEYVSPVNAIGDVGAATAVLNCVLAARAWARGYAAGRPLARLRQFLERAAWRYITGAAEGLMATVSVHPPKTPVTKGSNGIAAATIPNICKMPGPPAPFVPTPLPNIGKSGMSPKGYSTSVKIEGNAVAITGASFGSMGDIASKGLGGGIVSMNCEGPTKFIAPGSLTVKIEGKNVQLLGDIMSNNNGPAGSPPNSATMGGTLQQMAMAGGTNPRIVDCANQGFTDCEKEEVCHKCARINRKKKKLSKPSRSDYAKAREAGSAKAKSLAGKAKRNPARGAKLIKFQATSPGCQQEHVDNGFNGTSADHVHDIGLNGPPTANSNLRWMSSRANEWMGSVMGSYNPAVHTGVLPNCC